MAREREYEADERPSKRDAKGGGDTVMVGGMDDLVQEHQERQREEKVGDKGREVRREEKFVLDDERPPREVVADIEETDDERTSREQDREHDARLAYDEGGEGLEERGQDERGSRRQRRNRVRREAITQRDGEIASLRQMVEQQGRLLQSVAQGQIGTTISTVETQLSNAQQALNLADEELGKAVADSDGQRFREIQKMRDEAAARVFQLSGTRQRLMAEGGQVRQQPQQGFRPQQEQQRQQVDPRAQKFTDTFMKRFDWFDPEGTDEDSIIVRAVDDAVAAEGYLPTTPIYWRTLEERLAKRGITPEGVDEVDKSVERGDNREREERRPARRNGGMPPTSGGGGSRRPAAGGFRLQPDMRKYLEDEGLLDGKLDDAQLKRRDNLVRAWRENEQKAKRGEYGRS